MVRTLEEQGIRRLYPESYDPKAELKKLNRSILICFLELLDILIANPASPAVSPPLLSCVHTLWTHPSLLICSETKRLRT